MKLTSNRRMAVFLEKASKDNKDILPLNTWLEQLYLELYQKETSLPSLLSEKEAEVVWEKIVEHSEIGQSLLKTTGAAHLAYDAWKLCHQWKIQDFSNYQCLSTIDIDAYQDWADAYKQYCHQHHWVDFYHCIDLLANAIAEKKISLPVNIQLFGFEELSPQMIEFFKRATEHGSVIKSDTLVSFKSEHYYIETEDLEEELRLASSQAKHWLSEQKKEHHSSNCSIGIVIPDLQNRRSQVVRIFEETLLKSEFNVAAPVPLSDYPLIKAALMVLSFLNHKIPLEKISFCLRSPFFGHAISEMIPRAIMDVRLRNFNEAEFTLEQLLFKLEKEIRHQSTAACPQFFALIRRFVDKYPPKKKQTASVWAELFVVLLEALGWPGERALNVEETFVRQQWDILLAEYTSMERVFELHSYSDAIFRLNRLANTTPFLPPSNTAPIQVLGLLEAVGTPFDFLWITGMHREAWPPEPAPNPFIPLTVQRANDLPRSSAERELKMAKQFTDRLIQGARKVIFSYPKVIEDRTCRISSLLVGLPAIAKETLGLSKVQSYFEKISEIDLKKEQFGSTPQIQKADLFNHAPRLQIDEKISGGARILKLQSVCPLRAFAEIRLQATPLPNLQIGLNGAERGEITHQVLQLFWQDIPNQDTLNSLPKSILDNLIQSNINTVLKKWQTERPNTLTPQYVLLEKKRLFNLISRYIELEKTRPNFEVVAQEEEKIIELAGLKIRIRIDRIDKLMNGNGEEVLLDYKTGETSIRDWFGERPLDLQLPLYCATRVPTPSAIVFGIIRPDSIKYQGLSKEADMLPGVKALSKIHIEGCRTTWEEQTEDWRQILGKLAKDFSEGVAIVDPAQGPNTCRYCSLPAICRIKEDMPLRQFPD